MAYQSQGAMGRRYSLLNGELGSQIDASQFRPSPMDAAVQAGASGGGGFGLGDAAAGLGALQSARSGDQQGAALQGASMIPGPVGMVAQGIGLAKALTPAPTKANIQPIDNKDRMQRRLASIQSDPAVALEQGINAAASMPKDVQQQVLPQLVSARLVQQYGGKY